MSLVKPKILELLLTKLYNCGEYPFFRIIYITQEKGLCSESVKECEKKLLQITGNGQTVNQGHQGVENTVLQNKKMESFGRPPVKEVGT